jgi:hypothetical protein
MSHLTHKLPLNTIVTVNLDKVRLLAGGNVEYRSAAKKPDRLYSILEYWGRDERYVRIVSLNKWGRQTGFTYNFPVDAIYPVNLVENLDDLL